MSAVIAVDQYVSHTGLSLRIQLSHTSVLPGVFNGVCEDNLLASDVGATVVLVVPVDLGRSGIVREDVFAPLEPEVGTEEVRAHGLLRVGDLEPAELGAYLPRPLSRVVVDVVGDVLEHIAVVRPDIAVALDRKLIKDGELLLDRGGRNAVKDVAHLLSAAVLDGSSYGIRDVIHEVSGGEVSATEHLIDVVLVIRGKLSSDGVLNVVSHVADDIHACLSTALTRLVEVEVVHAVVLNNIDHTR